MAQNRPRRTSRNRRTTGDRKRRVSGQKQRPSPTPAPTARRAGGTKQRSISSKTARGVDGASRVVDRLLGLAPGAQAILRLSGPLLGLVMLAFASLGWLAHTIRLTKDKLVRCLLIGAAVLVPVAVALVLLLALQGGGQVRQVSAANTSPLPRLAFTHVGAPILEQVRTPERWFDLEANGSIAVFDNQGQYVTTYGPLGPSHSMAACAGSLFVTYKVGRIAKIARVNPWSGLITGKYPYSRMLGDLGCVDHKLLWVSEPAAGTVVEIDPRTLRYVYGDHIAQFVTSIAPGVINGYSGIWVVDAVHGELVGIAQIDGKLEKVGPFGVARGAVQLLYANPRMWLLYPNNACLDGFDSNGDLEDQPIPIAPGASHMSTSDGTIYVAGDKTITVVDTSDPSEAAQLIKLPDARRLVNANSYGGLLMAADATGDVFGVSPAAQTAREIASGKALATSCRP